MQFFQLWSCIKIFLFNSKCLLFILSLRDNEERERGGGSCRFFKFDFITAAIISRCYSSQQDLDLKSLLFEAFHKGQSELLYVVPFVAKVMEACLNSRVFKPPNPWTMAIINVLAELHQTPSLKLNLKFEVEVLCKNLGLDINVSTPCVTSQVFRWVQSHIWSVRLHPTKLEVCRQFF